jgi:hypothetical protein
LEGKHIDQTIKEYCKERSNSVDPVRFVDHYTANGWVRGKTPIKDWKACIRTWEKNDKQITSSQSRAPNKGNFGQRQYTDDQINKLYKE